MRLDEQLRRIEAAQADSEELALATLDILLASRPPELSRAFEAAAIPHWFDERLFAALLDQDLRPEAPRWYEAVRGLPAVEPFPARQGYNVHESTRLGLRRRLFAQNPSRFRELSGRAAEAFSGCGVHGEIERAYHALAASPATAGPALQELHLKLGRVEDRLSLARVLDEYAHPDWPPEARGWAFLASARYRADYLPHADTAAAAANALRAFREARDEWATALAHRAVGDSAIVSGKLAEALQHFAEFHRICENLVLQDGSNLGWQRELSVSLDRIGEAMSAQGNLAGALEAYREALAVSQRLVAADPSNTAWQRGLFISQSKVADVLMGQGDSANAGKAYREVLAINKRLAAADPSNAVWQRDLSVSLDRIGEALRAQGDLCNEPRLAVATGIILRHFISWPLSRVPRIV
jgi:tetratricopeptide (TPR) repeat protein